MGYRHYFYKASKKEVDKVKGMTFDELFDYAKSNNVEVEEYDDGKYFYFNDDKFLNKKEIYEFGKLYWDDTADRIYSKGVPLFEKQNVQDNFEDYVPFVVGKEGVIEAIEIYKEKTINNYKDLLKDGQDYAIPLGITIHKDDVKSFDKLTEFIEYKIRNISFDDFADINDKHIWNVTGSWDYEHAIFNLVHILKTVDWEKDTILFYGW